VASADLADPLEQSTRDNTRLPDMTDDAAQPLTPAPPTAPETSTTYVTNKTRNIRWARTSSNYPGATSLQAGPEQLAINRPAAPQTGAETNALTGPELPAEIMARGLPLDRAHEGTPD
jgi:hypothetical protein